MSNTSDETAGGRVASFVLLGRDLRDLVPIVQRAFRHPWVASYQIGFGPPLVRSSERLIRRLGHARSALEKLEVYFDVCFFDREERHRLAEAHRRRLVRRLGPLEAEAVRGAAAQVLDLSLRLYRVEHAPEEVQAEMRAAGITSDLVPEDLSLEAQSGRFVVHLEDPRNERLLFVESVAQLVVDPERAVALELRVSSRLRSLWQIWSGRLSDPTLPIVDLGDPRSVARVSRDGARR